jgi:riboflavin kinase/FMN adenylyltransferase
MRLIRLTEEYITRILSDADTLPQRTVQESSVALGAFDGLHLGHQELIQAVIAAKHRRNLAASCLFTFRRHPRLVLDRPTKPFLLTTWREKLSLLSETGLDVVVAADFCSALAKLPYREFVKRFLVDYLGMKHFVAGYDVHLGADRGGTAETLDALGSELGYGFQVVSALRKNGVTVSSSAIRAALEVGDCHTAAALLGRPYALWGEVIPGDHRGRSIGYPTANVTPLFEYKLLPAPGVYSVRVQVPGDAASAGSQDGELARVEEILPEVDRSGAIMGMGPSEWAVFGGMLNFGHVPTFHAAGLTQPRVEVHIFDFDGDLRGRTVKVDWMERLRDEQKFDSVEALIAQLGRDEKAARQVLGMRRR